MQRRRSRRIGVRGGASAYRRVPIRDPILARGSVHGLWRGGNPRRSVASSVSSLARDVNESHEIVCCEEMVRSVGASQDTFGVGLIPLGPRGDDRAQAVLLMRRKDGVRGEHDEQAFQRDLLRDSEQVRRRIETRLDPSA